MQQTLARFDRVLERVERLIDRYDPASLPAPDLFESCHAFRWEGRGRGGTLVPIAHPHLFDLDTLVGVDYAKESLLRNTAQFVAGLPANNVLLWGERGTGKSSCVKGLLPRFASQGLRLIEIDRGDLNNLPLVMGMVRQARYRFILFCDDLSFAEGDTSYQQLKVLLDGGLEARPDHMLVYATSNRRHLMPERMSDNGSGPDCEIHPEEAVSDKLALSDRFGLNLSFTSFNQQTYLAIIDRYAQAARLVVDEQLHRAALIWAMHRGQRSGRAAKQFVDDYAGRLLLG